MEQGFLELKCSLTKTIMYGKKITSYHRKLGHLTVLLNNRDPLKIFEEIDKTLSIIPIGESSK
jgi:phosphoribosylaminoimidazole carboxylase (NCAIR synthetase)